MFLFDKKEFDLIDLLTAGGEVTLANVLLILFVSCIAGLYIYLIYKNFCKAEFYSKDMNITMACMPVVVAAIMIAMQSNLIVSLGMVGALSIVRFRTAVKNPLDLLYLFWTISAGIICGVGLFPLCGLLCILMTLLLYVLGRIPSNSAPQLLIVNADKEISSKTVSDCVAAKTSKYKQKSVVVKNGNKELIYQVRVKSVDELVDSIEKLENVKSVTCIEHEGEMRA